MKHFPILLIHVFTILLVSGSWNLSQYVLIKSHWTYNSMIFIPVNALESNDIQT